MATHLEKRRRLWYAVLDVPTAQRPLIGKKRFVQSLGTDSLSVAKTRVLPIIHGWKMLIEEAKSGVVGAAQFRHFMDSKRKAGVPEWELQDATEALALEMGDIAFLSYQVATKQIVLLSEHLQPYLDDIRDKQMGQTLEYKERHLRGFLKALPYADEVTTESIEDYVAKNLSHLSKGTQTNHLSSFKMFWMYLGRKKIVPRGKGLFDDLDLEPRRFSPKDLESKRKHFSPCDYKKLLEAIVLKNKRDTSLYQLIQLGAYTGCRIEELCSLLVEDVNLPEEYLRIRDAKTEAGNRKVPIHPSILELVSLLVATTKDGFLLSGLKANKHNNRSPTLVVMFSELKTSLGYGGDYVFHSFRKGVATQLESAEVPEFIAARILGHKLKTNSYGLYSGGANLETLRGAISVLKW